MVKDELIWGKTQEEFAEYVSSIGNDAEKRSFIERSVATKIFGLPDNLPEEDRQEVYKRMEPLEHEELAHMDHYVRMADEYNARYDEVERTVIAPIMKKYEAKLDKQLTAYAKKTDGLEAYFTGIQRAVKREGKKVAAELDLGLNKKTLDSVLEGVSINLARMSNMVGGGILTVLSGTALQQCFDDEWEKWKKKHPKDILVTHNAEIEARSELIRGIVGKYFPREGCGGDCGGCGGSCG